MRALIVALVLGGCASDHAPRFDGVSCTWIASPAPSGGCDTLGRTPCDDWASSTATEGTAIARCAHVDHDADHTPLRCASADRCDGLACFCGAEAECGAGEACMLVAGHPRCVSCDP